MLFLNWYKLVFILCCFVMSLHSSQIVYAMPPSNFISKMTVSGCFCEKEGKILLLLRKAERTSGNTWGLPAGKILLNESPIAAAVRRLKEESGIDLPQEEFSMFKKFYIRLPSKDFELYLFKVNLPESQKVILNTTENSAFKWVTLSEALQLPLIPGSEVYMKLLAEKKSP